MATVRTRIGPTDRGRTMTLQEFREAEEQPGYLYELARGVLEVVNIPRDAHGQVVDNLHEAISRYRRDRGAFILRIAHSTEIRLVIPELASDRHPDLAIVFRGAPSVEEGHRLASLVVEVVSRGKKARRRDYEAKREEYLALGLGEYWIVDPDQRLVTVLVRRDTNDSATWHERVFSGDDTIASTLLPGFLGTVSELWADIDADRGARFTKGQQIMP